MLIPASYSIHFDSLDGIQTNDIFLNASVVSITENFTILEIAPLEFRRLWNITVFTYNCEQHLLTKEIELGNALHNI